MGPYDNKDIYDDPEGFGAPSSSAPGFEPPETYPAAPEIHQPETAATNGSSLDDSVNSATQQEQSAMDDGNGEKKAESAKSDSTPGDSSGKDGDQMKYTGDGKGENPVKRGLRKTFGKGNPYRGRNLALLGGFGVSAIGLVLVLIMFISSLSGFHAINASRLLLASFSIGAHQASTTYARIVTPDSTDKSKTRLTVDQKRLAKKMPAILDKAGIGFTYDSTTGKAISAQLDPSKQGNLGSTETDIKKNLAARYGIPEADIHVNPASIGGKVVINMRNKGITISENIIRDFADRTGRGKVMTFLISRHFRQYLNVPSLFHPFERAKVATKDAFSGMTSAMKAKALENERVKDFKAKMDATRLKLKGFFDANSFKIGVSRLSASAVLAMCAIRDVSTAIEEQNHASYVEPAQQSALDQIAQGDQVAYGDKNDYTADQIDSAAAHMYGDYYGQNLSIFDSDSMRARQGLPPIKITDATAAAHYAKDSATINGAFANTSSWQQAYDTTTALGGATICQPAAQAILTAGDIALTITMAAVSGGGAAVAKEAITMASLAGVMSLVIGYIESSSTNQLPEMTPNQGILGGDLMSHGADSVANVVNANSGGAVVSAERATKLRQEAAGIDLSLAKEQSIAQKLSPTNIYSPVAKLVNGINGSSIQNVRDTTNSFANILMSTIRLPFNLLSSRAHADSATSSTGNTVALTEAVETLINTERPSTIVSNAANIVRSQGYGGDLAQRAGVCFGATFLDSTDSDTGDIYFDIQVNKTVDPDSPLYKERNCADESSADWVTVSAAVHIIAVAEAATCRETQDTDACNRTGMGTTSSASTDTASSVDTSALYQDSSSIACDPRTVKLGQATVTNKGGSITIQLCGIKGIPSSGRESTKGDKYYVEGADGMSIVNSRVSKIFADLADAAKVAGVKLTSGSTFRTRAHQNDLWIANGKDSSKAAPAGSSNHEVGIAIDFSIDAPYKEGAACSERSTARSSTMWKFLNGSPGSPGAQKFGIYQYAAEGWHWDASPTRCKEPI